MSTGNLTARLSDDLERVREGLGDKASLFIQMFAAFISGFVVGFFYSWQMTVVMVGENFIKYIFKYFFLFLGHFYACNRTDGCLDGSNDSQPYPSGAGKIRGGRGHCRGNIQFNANHPFTQRRTTGIDTVEIISIVK
jgi:ABC-type multidrug transport system fused ATPase/permease subunit